MLFAQAAEPSHVASFSWGLFAIAAGLIAVGVVVLFLMLLFGYLRRSREMEHLERVKAFECGQPLDEPDSSAAKFMHNAFWISFWMVALIPYSAFSAAAATTRDGEHSVPLAVTVWLFAGLASIAAVAGATVLMLASRGEKRAAFMPGKKELVKDAYV
jgi:hypothetical protein